MVVHVCPHARLLLQSNDRLDPALKNEKIIQASSRCGLCGRMVKVTGWGDGRVSDVETRPATAAGQVRYSYEFTVAQWKGTVAALERHGGRCRMDPNPLKTSGMARIVAEFPTMAQAVAAAWENECSFSIGFSIEKGGELRFL